MPRTPTYRIVRFYLSGNVRTMMRGLTFTEAQSLCRDPETSSTTATSDTAKRHTEQFGPWFDGFELEQQPCP